MFAAPLRKLDDGVFLPILWIEITVGEMSDDIKSTIFHSTFSANVANLILKYGTLLIMMVTITLIAVTIIKLNRVRTKSEPITATSELEQLNKPDITHC